MGRFGCDESLELLTYVQYFDLLCITHNTKAKVTKTMLHRMEIQRVTWEDDQSSVVIKVQHSFKRFIHVYHLSQFFLLNTRWEIRPLFALKNYFFKMKPRVLWFLDFWQTLWSMFLRNFSLWLQIYSFFRLCAETNGTSCITFAFHQLTFRIILYQLCPGDDL